MIIIRMDGFMVIMDIIDKYKESFSNEDFIIFNKKIKELYDLINNDDDDDELSDIEIIETSSEDESEEQQQPEPESESEDEDESPESDSESSEEEIEVTEVMDIKGNIFYINEENNLVYKLNDEKKGIFLGEIKETNESYDLIFENKTYKIENPYSEN